MKAQKGTNKWYKLGTQHLMAGMIALLLILSSSSAYGTLSTDQNENGIQYSTGLITPTINGIHELGNTEFLGEWEDATKLDSILIGLNQPDVHVDHYRKVVGEDLFVAVRPPTNLGSSQIVMISMQIDRDSDGELSQGDVRIMQHRIGFGQVDGKNPVFNPIETIEGQIFDGENWYTPFDPNTGLPLTFSWGGINVGVSHIDQDPSPFIEMVAHLDLIDHYIGDLYPTKRVSQYEGEKGDFGELRYGLVIKLDDGTSFGYPIAPADDDDDNSVIVYDTMYYDVGFHYREVVNIGIDHIELTQTTQNENNDFSIVKAKDSLFRVFVKHDQPAKFVKARVYLNIYSGFGPASGSGYSATTDIIVDNRVQRGLLSDSANFRLSPAIMNVSTVLYSVRIVPLDSILGEYDDVDRTNNALDGFLYTTQSREMNVYVVRVNSNSYASPMLHSQDDVDLQEWYMSTLYPTHKINYFQEDWRVLGLVNGDSGAVMSRLNWLFDYLVSMRRFQIDAGIPHIRLPHQVHGFTTFGGGEADASWTAFGGSDNVAWSNRGTSGDLTMSHEINHNLGPGHWPEEWRGTWGKHVSGEGYGCGAFGGDGVWGGLYGDNFIHDLGWNSRDGLVGPSTPELMTYCNFGDSPPKWIGEYRWERLLTRIQSLTSDLPVVGGTVTVRPMLDSALTQLAPGMYTPDQAYSSTVRMISGSIDKDGTGVLDPSFELPGIWKTNDTNFNREDPNARIEVLYLNGTSVDIPLVAFAEYPDGSHVGSDKFYFSESIADNGQVISVSLINSTTGDTLAKQSDSQSQIDIGLQHPTFVKQGEEIDVYLILPQDNTTTLHSQLLYSPNGRGWLPLGEPTTSDVIHTTLGSYAGGDSSSLQLVVSDGLKTWVAQGSPIQVEHKPPTITLTHVDGDINLANITVGSTFSLIAEGIDELDWNIVDGHYDWEILNLDTNVPVSTTWEDAATKKIRFDKSGTYFIEVTTRDVTTGLTASASITVKVFDRELTTSKASYEEFQTKLSEAREDKSKSETSSLSSSDTGTKSTELETNQNNTGSTQLTLSFNFQTMSILLIVSLILRPYNKRGKQFKA